MRADVRRKAVGSAAGLFQGPAFLWGQFSPLVGASIDETGWVRWSALGLTLALVFGLAVLPADRFGARRLILTVCAGTLAGALLLTIGGAGATHAHAFAIVAVIGSFLQFAATRAGVLVSAHETRGMDADQQLARSRSLRRWFVIGIYLPSFGAGFLTVRYGWVLVYAALSALYTIALAVLWRYLRTDPQAPTATVPLAKAIRASVHDPLLLLTALAAFFAQAVVFGGVQGLPTVLRDYHVDASMIGYVQGSAIVAAVLVARPKKLAHATFGRLVPMVALIGAGIAAAVVAISHNGHGRALIVTVCAGCGLAFITMELLKQWSQSIAQIQARQHAPTTHDYVRQALWLLLANVGAIIGAEWIAKLATDSLAQWLLAIIVAAALFLATSLAWYEAHHRITRQRERPHRHLGGRHRASRGGKHPTHPHRRTRPRS
jgi:hypothetical protein